MKFLLYTILSGVILFGASCKKSFLDVEDNSQIIRQQYVTDLTSTQQYLNGIYVMLGKDFYGDINTLGETYPDLVSDNIKPSPNNTSMLIFQYNWQQDNRTNNRSTIWLKGYLIIRSCSFVIEKAQLFAAQDEVKAKQMQAEAYAIRALIHFCLVNTFAQSYNYTTGAVHPGVPFITTSDYTQSYTRNTVAEVYDGMINDLSTAISLFPSGSTNKLVMNKDAAKALLARIYLFKEDFAAAKALAIEVATTVPLMQAGSALYPSKLFTDKETEALFQLAPATTNGSLNTYDTYYQGSLYNGSTNTFFLATSEIASLLTTNPQDIRKAWISSGGAGKDSIRKFPINIVAGFGTTSLGVARSYYPTILRSSEMFLTVAEASAKTGDENTAKTYLDAIHKRAVSTATPSTATGNALLDSIYLERRKELSFEGLRMFDLLRWKKAVIRTDVATGGSTNLSYPNDKAIAPIPLTDAQYGIQQNAGYN